MILVSLYSSFWKSYSKIKKNDFKYSSFNLKKNLNLIKLGNINRVLENKFINNVIKN